MASFFKRKSEAAERFKARLAAGEIVTFINASHPSPGLVEKLAENSFDAVLIDCEHGTANTRDVEEMARAANLAGIVAIVRPERGIDWLVTRYLECGIDGLMFPLIHDAETARAMVAAVRLNAPFEYEKRVVIMMIESVAAVENLPAILAVEGIDAFLVAPGDLALSMGAAPYTYSWQGRERPAEVVAMVDRAIGTILAAGRPCGTLVNHSDIQDFIGKGVTLLYDHANHLLAEGARAFHGRIAAAPRRPDRRKM